RQCPDQAARPPPRRPQAHRQRHALEPSPTGQARLSTCGVRCRDTVQDQGPPRRYTARTAAACPHVPEARIVRAPESR
ncbi:hypothetical protein ABTL58_19395, partial [Acinetobacter baumannii]